MERPDPIFFQSRFLLHLKAVQQQTDAQFKNSHSWRMRNFERFDRCMLQIGSAYHFFLIKHSWRWLEITLSKRAIIKIAVKNPLEIHNHICNAKPPCRGRKPNYHYSICKQSKSGPRNSKSKDQIYQNRGTPGTRHDRNENRTDQNNDMPDVI